MIALEISVILVIYLIANLVIIYIEYKSYCWLDKKLNIRLFGIYVTLFSSGIIMFLIFSFVQNYYEINIITSLYPQFGFNMLSFPTTNLLMWYMHPAKDAFLTFQVKAIFSLAPLPFFISNCFIGFMLFKRRISREKEAKNV